MSHMTTGGLKVWESSLDLVRYLETNRDHFFGRSDVRVLEAGCGHGFPGVYSVMQGAKVLFSDLNYDVLDSVTIKNVLMNSKAVSKVSMLGGDWDSLSAHLGPPSFDIILSAETLYTKQVGFF